MQKPLVNLSGLNTKFHIDNYLELDSEGRRDFRFELKDCISALQKEHKLKMMTKEDLVLVGMRLGNRSALAITILVEKLTGIAWPDCFLCSPCLEDKLFHSHDAPSR